MKTPFVYRKLRQASYQRTRHERNLLYTLGRMHRGGATELALLVMQNEFAREARMKDDPLKYANTYCMGWLPETNALGFRRLCQARIPVTEHYCADCKKRTAEEQQKKYDHGGGSGR